jgi:dephospho-CoA kinase
MLLVGLTGGIGSGKSTVARMLAERGAVVVDADAFARDALAPGTAGLRAVAERFGPTILRAGGELDREALARIVFADVDARRDLEAIVHPEVRRRIAETIAPFADTDRLVVMESPLLIEAGGRDSVQLLVVVAADEAVRVARLERDRGMAAEDVRARIAAQASPSAAAALADVVIDNHGTIDDLERQVERLWARLDDEIRDQRPARGASPAE